ncbi:B3 domain-containing protein REM9-like [Rosa rugosa]|uniref:B3 domain-containing protein REM9-like n=1 Tax=Rosa rugosa TaxID=74645 RepID=UPI002B40B7AB|nr:B3 domain-containing protein REM9-like [Rosa rugosa]
MSVEKDGRVPGGLSGTQRFLKKTSHKSLPSEFSRRHLIKQPANNITLRVLDGRIWSVEFTYTKEKAQFQGGWLTFVKDNNLEVGDVCVFVLIKDIKLLLGVFFFRTSEATTWFLSNVFAKTYLTKLSSGVAILQVSDGRTWPVNFKFDHANSRARLMKGWSPFVRDNNLKVGDVCIFTLINCTELVFDVVFSPTEESAERPLSTGHGRGATVQVREMKRPLVEVESECGMNCEIGKNKMSNISGQVTQRPSSSLRTARVNLEAASKFSSKNPFFKVTLGSGHTVHVPVNFARSFIKQEKQTVMLQVKDR